MERDREVWTVPRRIGEGQGMVRKGEECQEKMYRAMEGMEKERERVGKGPGGMKMALALFNRS